MIGRLVCLRRMREKWLARLYVQERRRELGCYERLVEVLRMQKRALELGDEATAASLLARKRELLAKAREAADRCRLLRGEPRGEPRGAQGARWAPGADIGAFVPLLANLVELERETQELLTALSLPSRGSEAQPSGDAVPRATDARAMDADPVARRV